MPSKQRLDILLVKNGLAGSQQEAQRLVLAGLVYQQHRRLEKPGEHFSPNAAFIIKERKKHPWVSRGGIKLAHAIQYYALPLQDKVALDIGASTGGFTEVLLHYGIKKVYAIDVAYGELAWKLRQDPRVVVMERTNARYLTRAMIADIPEVVVCDASFISLTLVLPAALSLVGNGGILVALIKPQFEVLREEVGQGGIITDTRLHARVCNDIKAWLERDGRWHVEGITPSPIKGAEGNTEFLLYARCRS